jgi:two-component system chemotaxis response regulator CheY
MPIEFGTLICLIIEDSSHMRGILRAMLEGLGVKTIYEAGDGMAGLAILRRSEPDLVLLDWAMPIMDGIEFLREARQKDQKTALARIVMVTAFTERAKLDQAYAAGIDEIVSKPFSARALHGAIERTWKQRRPFVTRGDYLGPDMPGAHFDDRVETAS